MKKILSIVVVALVAIVCGGRALAATPLAVWDGDFSSATQGDFTITATNGNTIADKSITIAEDATGGVVFTGPNSSLNNSTVIIKGTGLNLESTLNQYLFAVCHDSSTTTGWKDLVGASLKANNEKVQGIWLNNMYDTAGDSLQVAASLTSGSVIAVNIQVTNGVFVYEITDGKITKVYGHLGLKASQCTYKGFSLGGSNEYNANSTLNPAVDWQIKKVAVFGSTLSEEEILGYTFPSEAQTINGFLVIVR